MGKRKAKNGRGTPPGKGQGEGSLDRADSTPRILAELEAYSRAPLQRELAKWLDCAPDQVSLQAFANKAPDRWGQGCGVLLRGAGYSEKIAVSSTNIAILIGQLSDAEVIAQLAEVHQRLRALDEKHGEPKAIEAETDEPHKNRAADTTR